MADPHADLIDRLLASGKISRDTRAELGEFKQELANGTLDAGDRRYLEALGQRLLGARRRGGEDGAAGEPPLEQEGEDEGDDEGLGDQGLWDVDEDAELTGWRDRAEKAELRVAELEAEVAALKTRLGES